MISTRLHPDKQSAAQAIAREIADLIQLRSKSGKPTVLGLATGSTPLPLYAELIRLHREEGLSFRSVITFNLDEYEGLGPDHPQSYRFFMEENLFRHLDIPAANIHIPDGMAKDPASHCAEYETAIRAAGGIDLQILGIGRTGHIGFNEPPSPAESRTR